MATEQQVREQDFSALSDECIIERIRHGEGGCRAIGELVGRHRDWMRRNIEVWASKAACLLEDIEDAKQNSLFALLYAIRTYQAPCSETGYCSFRTYLGSVQRLRFDNYLRHLRREEGHLDRRIRAAQVLSDSVPPLAPPARPQHGNADGGPDPVSNAQQHELSERLHEALQHLDPRSREICEHLTNGMPRRDIAARLGISYYAVRKLIDEITAHLLGWISDWRE
jgi:RNA polymerase sigma factor (sigma-70 family)